MRGIDQSSVRAGVADVGEIGFGLPAAPCFDLESWIAGGCKSGGAADAKRVAIETREAEARADLAGQGVELTRAGEHEERVRGVGAKSEIVGKQATEKRRGENARLPDWVRSVFDSVELEAEGAVGEWNEV